MITVPDAARKIVERSRYLSEAISKGIINYSSLARYIKPELEEMLVKKVSLASVIMALNRLESSFQPKFRPSNIFKAPPEITVRSNLHFVSLANNEIQGLSVLISRDANSRSFFLKNQGIHESSLILSQDLFEKYENTIKGKNPLALENKVSVITIYLPKEALKTSGIYYFFLKSLAWEGINILELGSTPSELSLIVSARDTERAFTIIKSLFSA
jgi:hypothetical protein